MSDTLVINGRTFKKAASQVPGRELYGSTDWLLDGWTVAVYREPHQSEWQAHLLSVEDTVRIEGVTSLVEAATEAAVILDTYTARSA